MLGSQSFRQAKGRRRRANQWQQSILQGSSKHMRLRVERLEERLCLSGDLGVSVIAQTGAATPFNFTSLGRGPSINNDGYIAFVGESANEKGELSDNIYAYRPETGSLNQLMNRAFMYPKHGVGDLRPGTQAIFDEVQINDSNQVLARRRLNAEVQVGLGFGEIVTAPLTYLETWDADAPSPPGLPSAQVAIGVPARASAPIWFFLTPSWGGEYPSPLNLATPYEALYSRSTINNLGQVNFSAIVYGAGNNRVSSNVNGDLVQRGGIGSLSIYPMLADNGYYVFGTNDGRVFVEPWSGPGLQLLAGSSNGFTAVSKPGISDDGHVIVFAGSKATVGPGLYLSRFDAGYSSPVRILGISGDGILDPGEMHNDRDGDGIVDPGEDEGGFTAFDLTSRVGVNRYAHVSSATYKVAFLGDDSNGTTGLYTLEIDLDAPSLMPTVPMKIMAHGDLLAGIGTVDAISMHDPLNTQGTIVFHVSSGAVQAVLSYDSSPRLEKPPFEILARGVAYDNSWHESSPPQEVWFDGMNLHYVVDRVFKDSSSGLYALGLLSDKYGPALVLRGTELTSVRDIWADLDWQGVGYSQFVAGWRMLSDWLDTLSKPVDIVGHSLGGALAQWIGVALGGAKVDQLVTFNSPGISRAYAETFRPGEKTIVTHYIVNGDVVSLAGEAFVAGEVRMASFESLNLI